MSYRPGYVDRQGRIYFRCPDCGDSKNPNHAHAFLDTMGGTYCYRCRESTSLSIEEIFDIMLGNTTAQEVVEDKWLAPDPSLVQYNKGRHTLLDKWQVPNTNDIVFIMYDQCGNPIGQHTRGNNKGINAGRSGISWPNVENCQDLVSSPSEPLVAVEGPFDLLRHNYVCMFGQITYSKLKFLRLQWLWVWPDPDIIDSDQKRRKFVTMLKHANNNLCNIMGMIVSNADPDEHTIKVHIPFEDLDLWLEEGSRKWLANQNTARNY